MSSHGVGISIYPTSSFFQAVLPAGSPVETSHIACADSQYATLFFNISNASPTSNVAFIITDQPFSGSAFYQRGIENPLYLDVSAVINAPAYQTNVYTSFKSLGVGLNGTVNTTIPLFGSYAFSLYLIDMGDMVAPATVSASVVLFKAI